MLKDIRARQQLREVFVFIFWYAGDNRVNHWC